MECKLKVFLFLVMTFECNGHLPILGDILSTAHKHIQSGVEGVAGAVLGGVNFNLGGFVDFNRRNNPENVPQKGSDETIIVVVEEPGHSDYGNTNNYRPNYNPPPPPYHNERPPSHFDSGRPPHHHHHHQTPHGYPRPGYNDQNQGPYHHNEHGINQDSGNSDNGNYFYGNNQNSRPHNNNNGNLNNNNYQPYPTDNQEHQKNNNNPKNIYDGHTTLFSDNPTTEYVKTPDPTKVNAVPKDEEVNKATEKSSDDLPLFVPLTPDEYVYGGDKINITAPKRDTDKTKPEKSDDDDFAIDIRLKDE